MPETPPPSMLIEFSPPLVWAGKTLASIELCEPKAKHVAAAQAEVGDITTGTVKYAIALISQIVEQPKALIELMPISKLMQGLEYVMSFFAIGQQTGET